MVELWITFGTAEFKFLYVGRIMDLKMFMP